MWAKQTAKTGFTIVELLIVIVVIGILAAITIVAYSGVQNRANDTAIKSDLTNFAKRLELVKLDTADGLYPTTFTSSMGFSFSRDAYGISYESPYDINLAYCRNATTNEYIMYARSKSGNAFKYTSAGGLASTSVTYGWSICSQIGLASTNPSTYGHRFGAWTSWVN